MILLLVKIQTTMIGIHLKIQSTIGITHQFLTMMMMTIHLLTHHPKIKALNLPILIIIGAVIQEVMAEAVVSQEPPISIQVPTGVVATGVAAAVAAAAAAAVAEAARSFETRSISFPIEVTKYFYFT